MFNLNAGIWGQDFLFRPSVFQTYNLRATLANGMGTGFVLVAWGVIGLVLAGIGSLTMRWVVAYLTRGADDSRRWLLDAVTVFPLACLAWAGTVFVFQAVVNVVL